MKTREIRVTTDPGQIYEFAGFRVDARTRVLMGAGGAPIAVMPKAFDTLLFLLQNAGRTVTKEEIFAAVWSRTIVEENNLTQNISALRKLFREKPGEHRFIVTVPGRGYRFVAPVAAAVGLTDAFSGGERASGRTRSIAVLPFKRLVEEARNEALELGVADSLILQLGNSPDLAVRPLSATRRFAALEQDPIEAGRLLGVDVVVDGTIHATQDRLRAGVRMFRVADSKQIYAKRLDERFADIFAVQDAIAQSIADSIEAELKADRRRYEPRNTDAYELYLTGRLHAGRLIAAEVRKGLEHFERAIASDPTYALPHLGIAEAQLALILSNDVRPDDVVPRAKVAALRALELAPELPEVHTELGMIALFFDWDWAAAEHHLREAVELGPSNAQAHIFLAHLHSNLGRKSEALSHALRARELDPTSVIIRALEGQFLGHQGEHDEAIDRLRRAVDLDAHFWLSHHLLANALIDAGDYEEALEQASQAARLAPQQTYSDAIRGLALARLGRHAEVKAALDALRGTESARYVPPTHLAMLCMADGDEEAAIGHLERGLALRDARMAFLNVEPKWNSLRSEPGFIEIIRKLAFP